MATRSWILLVGASLLISCTATPGGTPASPVPSSGANAGSGVVEPTAPPTPSPVTSSPAASTPVASADLPTAAPSTTPALSPWRSPGSATLPVRGLPDDVLNQVLMAPLPGGSVYVSIPSDRGAVLALLGTDLRSVPGWPIEIAATTRCTFIGAADDGSVRAICDATDIRQPDWCCDTARAFAFDHDGRIMPGWPVEVPASIEARVIGRDFVLFATEWITDVEEVGAPSHRSWLLRIGPDGAVTKGAEVGMVATMGQDAWAIGPDGVAYGTESVGEWTDMPTGNEKSRVLAVDQSGLVAGWPVSIDGVASGPAFAPDGRILVAVGVIEEPRSWVVALEPSGTGPAVSSATLPLTSAITPGGIACSGYFPVPPLTAERTIVTSDWVAGSTWYALGPALEPLSGWPVQQAGDPQSAARARPGDVDCAGLAFVEPVLGSDGTLYFPLAASSVTTGGSLTAIGRDGAVVPGWPVELRRADAGFWSVVVGADGAVFALAVEPEAGGGDSATILAIDPAGAVRWRTTIVEP